MPKKVKLNIQGLKVQSFVTSLEEDSQAKAKGGHPIPETCQTCDFCSITYRWQCPDTASGDYCHTACGCTNPSPTMCPCISHPTYCYTQIGC
jgi:hypothetical protein